MQMAQGVGSLTPQRYGELSREADVKFWIFTMVLVLNRLRARNGGDGRKIGLIHAPRRCGKTKFLVEFVKKTLFDRSTYEDRAIVYLTVAKRTATAFVDEVLRSASDAEKAHFCVNFKEQRISVDSRNGRTDLVCISDQQLREEIVKPSKDVIRDSILPLDSNRSLFSRSSRIPGFVLVDEAYFVSKESLFWCLVRWTRGATVAFVGTPPTASSPGKSLLWDMANRKTDGDDGDEREFVFDVFNLDASSIKRSEEGAV